MPEKKSYSIERNKLYYQKETCAVEYNNKGQGTISLPRLIQGKACFRKSTPARKWYKKTIVITDWTAEQWDSLKIRKVQQLIKDKLEEGFNIYIWQENHLKKISRFIDGEDRKLITPVSAKEIHEKTKKIGLTPEQVYILDDYEIEQLFTKTKDRIIRSDEYQNTKHDKEKLQNVLKELPLKRVEYNAFPNNPQNARNLSNILQVPLVDSIQKLSLDDTQLQQLIKNKKLNILNKVFEESALEQIEYLHFTNQERAKLSKDQLASFFAATKNLIHLKTNKLHELDSLLQNNKHLKNLAIVPADNQPKSKLPITLKKTLPQHWEVLALDLDKNKIDSKSLNNLLHHVENLQNLELTNAICTGIINPIALPALIRLVLEDLSLPIETLNNLLVSDLLILYIGDIDFIGNIKPQPRPLLECLYIKSKERNFTAQNLQALIQETPNLRILDLEGIIFTENIKFARMPLLTSCYLENCSISSQNLNSLLINAPHLKELQLKNIAFTGSLDFSALTDLTSLKLTNCTLSAENLNFILKNAPNLKKIELNNVNITGIFEAVNLASLTQIHLTDCKLNAENINALLQNKPKLSSLIFENSELSAPLSPLSLPSLTYLEFSKTKLSSQNANNFLNASTKLETLNCTESNITGNIECPTIKTLKKLFLLENNFSEQNLQNLLQKNEQVEQLYLRTKNLSNKDLNLPAAIKDINVNNYYPTNSHPALIQLKSFTLFSTKIPPSQVKTWEELNDIDTKKIEEILHLAANIETLQLYGHVKNKFNFHTFPTLNEFELMGSISQENLCILLQNAKNLKKLSLFLNNDLGTFNKVMHLPFLESFTVKSGIRDSHLYSLLVGMPNLKTLDLRTASSLNLENLTPELKKLLDAIPTVIYPEKWDSTKEPTHPSINHPHKQSLSYKPTPPDFQFTYKNTNKAKNQAKVVEQLSQYLTLTQKHLDWIPKIQDGICNSLAYFWANKTVEEWDEWLKKVAKWNGQNANDIKNCFEELIPYVAKYNRSKQDRSTFYGEALFPFLSTYASNDPLILTNYWHAISIKRLNNTSWYLYDPEDVEGGKTVQDTDLKEQILYSLGSLIGSPKNLNINPEISSTQQFIEEGGLLALCIFSNPEAILKTLSFDKEDIKTWPDAVLEGLFVREINGQPAWYKAMQKGIPEVKNITTLLLEEFHKRNPDTYQSLLDLSIKDMVILPEEKVEETTQSTEVNLPPTDNKSSLPFADLVALYKKRLSTWEKNKSSYSDIKEYSLEKVKNIPHKKKLIEVSSLSDLQSVHAALLTHCKNTSRPVFSINSPEDLMCALPYMKLSDPNALQGHLVKGPGGALHQFLQENKDKNPILLVNYSNFEPQDLVRFNTLLDPESKVDGVDLPPSTLIIGLMDTSSSNCYQGSDFYSRFNEVEHSILNPDLLTPFSPQTPPLLTKETKDPVRINLFHANDWKERLLGRWVLQGQKLFFEEGALIPALRTNKPIVIENGLWNNPEFTQFWQELLITKQIRQPAGIPAFNFNNNPILFHNEGYDWDALLKNTSWDKTLQPEAEVLNSNQLGKFFYRYEYADSSLNTLPGLLEVHPAHTPLHLNLTQSPSEDEWAQFLTKARELNIALHLHCAPGIRLPELISSKITVHNTPLDTHASPDEEWTSTDTDTTVAKLMETKKPDLVLDISECDATDLLIKIKGELTSDLSFKFTKKECILTTALEEGKTILLKGQFSQDLAEDLAPLLLARRTNGASGHLLLVHEGEKIAPYLPQNHHKVKSKEKSFYLNSLSNKEGIFDKKTLKQHSLAKLKARLHSLKRHPDAHSDKAWEGMYNLPTLPPLEAFDPEHSKAVAETFMQNRLDAVNQVLEDQPFVFLTGLTAVGKTTFVSKYLNPDPPFYQGENSILNWAKDTSSQRKILFLDEANLSSKQWTEMEGLFTKPKGLLIDGEFIPLDENHKVVFAGNPLSYGDDRKIASFFARHGNTVLFQPLPLASVYEDILKPVFESTPLDKYSTDLCKPFLNIYSFLYPYCTEEMLITPRELQMMALLTSSYCKQFPDVNPQQVAEYYAYQLGSFLVPPQYKAAFTAQFPKPEELERAPLGKFPQAFKITPSRQFSKRLLDDLLQLRQFRRDSADEIQQYGGLGGLIFQGDPGVGKSELIIHTLIQHGYQEIHNSEHQEIPERGFYRIPASLNLEEKEKLLLKAFDEGSLVIIDEINSSPLMEQLLNSLLMGKTLEGKRPQKPGFMIIGTQNPATMGGRKDASIALARRLLTVEIPPYPSEELQDLLIHKGLDAYRAEALVYAYNQQVSYAKAHHLSPAPCFRDLMNVTQEILTGTFKTTLPKVQPTPTPAKVSNYSFLLKAAAVISLTLSLAAVIVAVLALTSVITLSTAGVGTVIGAGVIAAAGSLGLFKAAGKERGVPEQNVPKNSLNK